MKFSKAELICYRVKLRSLLSAKFTFFDTNFIRSPKLNEHFTPKLLLITDIPLTNFDFRFPTMRLILVAHNL